MDNARVFAWNKKSVLLHVGADNGARFQYLAVPQVFADNFHPVHIIVDHRR